MIFSKYTWQFDFAFILVMHPTFCISVILTMYLHFKCDFYIEKETRCKWNSLCCEYLQQLLSNWGCFLDLLVLFLFARVFWSCSALNSLGHCRKCFIGLIALLLFDTLSYADWYRHYWYRIPVTLQFINKPGVQHTNFEEGMFVAKLIWQSMLLF